MEVDVAQDATDSADSDKDDVVVKYAVENVTPTFEEIDITSCGSAENIEDYMDDSIVESLNKPFTEGGKDTLSNSSSDHVTSKLTEDVLTTTEGKYNRSQSCASNISNQSKERLQPLSS